MTRINLVDPKILTDQHLFTEYRELPRILNNVRNAISSGKTWTKHYAKNAPRDFVLGTGHMVFFYNRIGFLLKRHQLIVDECIRRGINISHTDGLDASDIPDAWKNDYNPTASGIELSKQRLNEKIMMKPDWYRFWGTSLTDLETQPCCDELSNFC